MTKDTSEKDSMEEALLEEKSIKTFNTSEEEEAAIREIIREIIAIATTEGEEEECGGLNIIDGGTLGFDADAQAPLVAEDTRQSKLLTLVFNDKALKTLCFRFRRVYLSPALVWLEEEGLPTAESEAKDIGVEVDEEGVMKKALQKWKMMGSKEKDVWRKRAEENANKKI